MKNFKIEINCEALGYARDLITKRLLKRGLTEGENGLLLKLVLNEKGREDAYRIAGDDNAITITADSFINVLAGCGSFLRNSHFTEDGIIPSQRRGLTTPDCDKREIYLANHFHNYFHQCSIEELTEYLEDMALRGFNSLCMATPCINLRHRDDPAGIPQTERLIEFFRVAKKLGMTLSSGIRISTTYIDFPKELERTPVPDPMSRRGQAGNVLCISKPGALEWLEADNRAFFKVMKDAGIEFDYLISFPYDEGGCGCPECSPWGANGYIRAIKYMIPIAKEYFPSCKIIVSTWCFDLPESGEWEGLAKSLEEEKWCDIIEADAHEDYPRYPIEHGVPGNLPLHSFPEISMWWLSPWGGFGASMFPKRMTAIWRQTKGLLSGERLYSEGIYDDVNKAVIAGLCEDYNREPEETLAQYARYELGITDTDKFVRMIDLIETNHVFRSTNKGIANPILADEAYELSKEIENALPDWSKQSWRWRLIAIRTFTDVHRYRNEDLCENPETLAALHEVIEISKCIKNYDPDAENKPEDFDPYHKSVRPPCPAYED